MSKTRPTQPEQWLAAGHRYDDVALWRDLCQTLEARGLTPTAELPAHLAPLVFRDPENTYLAWLREYFLVPVTRLRGRAKQAGNGWRVRADWQQRLAVMADPTAAHLLQWWRALEPTLRAGCLERWQRDELVDGPSVTLRVTSWGCALCAGGSWWDSDPRGIVHDWRGKQDRTDCRLLRLHLTIRAAAQEATPLPPPQAALADELQHLADHYGQIGQTFQANIHRALGERDLFASAGLERARWAACHIAQFCGVWMEPTPEEVRTSARYLRGCGRWPLTSPGMERYQGIADELYSVAARQLEALIG